MTRREKQRLLKALNSLPRVTGFHVWAAFSLLQINGLENALEYVEAIRRQQQPTLFPLTQKR